MLPVSQGAPPTITIKAHTCGWESQSISRVTELLHSSLNNLKASGIPSGRRLYQDLFQWIITIFRFPAKMKLLFQICFFCWCLLTIIVLSVESAKLDLTSQLKKRLSIWVQSRTKRDVNSLSASEMSEAESFKMGFVRPDDVKDTLNPHSSNDINIRVKRYKSSVSQSKGMGCSLGTCSVHDLAHRLFQLTDKHKDGSAPMDKISPLGYGRRRRSLPENRVTFQLLGRRLRPAWKSTNRGEKLRELLRRT